MNGVVSALLLVAISLLCLFRLTKVLIREDTFARLRMTPIIGRQQLRRAARQEADSVLGSSRRMSSRQLRRQASREVARKISQSRM